MGKSNRLHYRLGPAELFPNFAAQVESAFTLSVLLWKAAALETSCLFKEIVPCRKVLVHVKYLISLVWGLCL